MDVPMKKLDLGSISIIIIIYMSIIVDRQKELLDENFFSGLNAF
ncbi:hypothetical protein BMS3Abin03_01865 [bacterium BMS3Abin03]|nr:hypothetical protein BMS3Abin03_01865 [bacterium BMS3Abin03]